MILGKKYVIKILRVPSEKKEYISKRDWCGLDPWNEPKDSLDYQNAFRERNQNKNVLQRVIESRTILLIKEVPEEI